LSQVDTSFGFGNTSATTPPASSPSFGAFKTPSSQSKPASAARKKTAGKKQMPENLQAYSVNNPPVKDGGNDDNNDPSETEAAGFQSSFKLPNDPSFAKKQELEDNNDASNENDDDDDVDYVSPTEAPAGSIGYGDWQQ
jgi:hypothetical protein